jgi:biopolymer transport protein ExbD
MPMTPMIDVVFQLLIFFVCTASFQAPEELLPAHLSSGATAPAETADPEIEELEQVVVRVETGPGGGVSWRVNDRPCTALADVRDVLSAVAAVRLDLPVVLDIAGDVPLGNMVDVWDLCRLVGFQKIQFAAAGRME